MSERAPDLPSHKQAGDGVAQQAERGEAIARGSRRRWSYGKMLVACVRALALQKTCDEDARVFVNGLVRRAKPWG